MATEKFKTVKQTIDYLLSEDIEADVIAVPPELDELTDEENIEDDLIGNTHVSDISGATEVFHEERNEDFSDVSAKRVRKEEVKWCAQSPTYSFPNLGQKAYEQSEELKHK